MYRLVLPILATVVLLSIAADADAGVFRRLFHRHSASGGGCCGAVTQAAPVSSVGGCAGGSCPVRR